jgi:hypothetical protein
VPQGGRDVVVSYGPEGAVGDSTVPWWIAADIWDGEEPLSQAVAPNFTGCEAR